MNEISNILSNFQVSGSLESCEPFGTGHINDTYRVVLSDGGVKRRYVLQRVNNKIFTNPEALMSNFAKVTSYLGKLTKQALT